MELVWPVEGRPRQAGPLGLLCDWGGHKPIECAHLVPPAVATYRIIDLHDQGLYMPTGDFTHVGLGGEPGISWSFHWTLGICWPWTGNGLCSERMFSLISFEFVMSPVRCNPFCSWITNEENSTLRHVLFLPKRLNLLISFPLFQIISIIVLESLCLFSTYFRRLE